jgi:DNA gyrase subunit B
MNPETRTMSLVTIDNYIEADKIFGILMGNDVEPRRDFVQNNSDLAENIDI